MGSDMRFLCRIMRLINRLGFTSTILYGHGPGAGGAKGMTVSESLMRCLASKSCVVRKVNLLCDQLARELSGV